MPRKLPPPRHNLRSLVGPEIAGYTVADWCPDQEAKVPPEAVALILEMRLGGDAVDIVMRLKSPQAVDTMIQALLRHKRSVWPDAP
jgi:hypothetical protein